MDLPLAMSAMEKCMIVLLFTGVAAPMAGALFWRVAGGWDSIGKGPFAIGQEPRPTPRHLAQPSQAVDPAIQAAEVRQMLTAKSERQRRRGEAPIDVETEATRLLTPEEELSPTARQDAELRAEVRQLIVIRNERRMHKGLQPLDVEAETERQLTDFIGSR